MKIYITIHGLHEVEHVSMCTLDFDFAIKHFLDYYNENKFWNTIANIQIWENNKCIFEYGNRTSDIIHCKKELSYDEIKQDILKQLKGK